MKVSVNRLALLWLITLLALLGIALGACSDLQTLDESSTSSAVRNGEDPGDGPSSPMTTCNDNCDCGYGAFCNDGACEGDFGPFAPCYCAPRDCPAGYLSCQQGFCSTQAPSCADNCDCAYGNVCANGQCQPDFGPFPPCFCGYRDCGPGQTCNAGFCSP